MVPSSATYFSLQYPLLSSRSHSRWVRLLPRLLLSSILTSVFPLITCFGRRFLRKVWPIHLFSLLVIVCRIFLPSLTLCNTSSFLTRSVQLIFSIILQHHISKISRHFWSTVRSVPISAPKQPVLQMQHFASFFLKLKTSMLVKRAFLLTRDTHLMQQFIYYYK